MLNSQVGQLIAKSLVFDAQTLAFLLPILDLLLEQYAAFNGDIVPGFHVLERASCVPGLPFVIIIGDFNIP